METKNPYEKAYQIAIEELSQRDLEEVAFNSSVQLEPASPPVPGPRPEDPSGSEGSGRGKTFILPALGETYKIEERGRKITRLAGGSDPKMAVKLVLLHYLITADGTPLRGEELSFDQIPGAGFYYPTFKARTIDQLTSAFQNDLARFIKVGLQFKGKLLEGNSNDTNPTRAHIKFFVLPNVPISFIYWRGEEDLPPALQILFDVSITHYLPLEDIVVVTELWVHQLIQP